MKSLLWTLLTVVLGVTATVGPLPSKHNGLAGIAGFKFYNPVCAHGCFRSFSPYLLSCSSAISEGGMTTADEVAHDLALCRSTDFPYLSSIAWCIHTFCPNNTKASTIEKFWATQITGDATILPKWTYGETMANITKPPTEVAMGKDLVLTKTMLTTYTTWKNTRNTIQHFYHESALESYYGWVPDSGR